MSPSSRRAGYLAAALSLAMAGAFAILIPRAAPGPPEEVERALATGLLLGVPGLLGLVGAVRGARPILVAAGMLSLLQSIVSFAGVTLVFLAPALGFFAAASEPRTGARTVRWAPGRLALAVIVGAVGAVAIVRLTGILGVLGLVVIAGFARARAAHAGDRPAVSRSGALLCAVLVALVVGGWAGLLGTAEERCWIGRETPGGLACESAPVSHQSPMLGGPDGAVAFGCTGGALTWGGMALAAVLVVGAVSLAATVPLGASGERP